MAQDNSTAGSAADFDSSSSSGSSSDSGSDPSSDSGSESIGTCFMQEDGALVLTLRATGGPGGAMGTALVTYNRGHENYGEILAHVQPIKPGETKSVAPWPD